GFLHPRRQRPYGCAYGRAYGCAYGRRGIGDLETIAAHGRVEASAEARDFGISPAAKRWGQATRPIAAMSPRPASSPATEISSSRASQWRPAGLIWTAARASGEAARRRGNQASG